MDGISDGVALRFGTRGEHDFAKYLTVLGAFISDYTAYAASANDENSFRHQYVKFSVLDCGMRPVNLRPAKVGKRAIFEADKFKLNTQPHSL
jgi:hypothetical protein